MYNTDMSRYDPVKGLLVAGLPLICIRAEHQGIRQWAEPTSMIAEQSSIQSIQTSCSYALPVNIDRL